MQAGAEMIAQAYFTSYKMPIITTRGNNVYGPHQASRLLPGSAFVLPLAFHTRFLNIVHVMCSSRRKWSPSSHCSLLVGINCPFMAMEPLSEATCMWKMLQRHLMLCCTRYVLTDFRNGFISADVALGSCPLFLWHVFCRVSRVRCTILGPKRSVLSRMLQGTSAASLAGIREMQ